MAIFYNTSIVRNGLTMHFDGGNVKSYNSATSTSTWIDLSGQGNAATVVGSIGAPSQTTGAFTLNGSNQYANVANSFVTTATYTKSIWFNIANLAATNNLLSGNTIFWLSNSNILRASDTSQANYSIAAGSIPLSTSTWYNGVVTYNSLATTGTWKLYVNGVLDTTTYANSNPVLGNIQVGAFGSGYLFQGQLACPMIYNRVLSDAEVLQNFQALRDRFGV
jgi:hypothetical protein